MGSPCVPLDLSLDDPEKSSNRLLIFWSLWGFHNCCTSGFDQNVVRAKKFAICFINVRMKKCSYESTRDLKRHWASVVQRYVIDLAICLTSWCVRFATKASVAMRRQHRTSSQMIGQWNMRQCDWTYGERTIMRAIVRVLATALGGIYNGQSRRASGSIGTAASMVLSWKSSLVWKIACRYGVYILVGKWRATVVQRYKVICDMSYNTLMVVQHTHTNLRIILRP